jgi:hypothetical protein
MRNAFLSLFAALGLLVAQLASATPLTIVGTYHCSNDGCGWNTVRNMTDFDTQNHWLIDRGDGSGQPSVNLVVLSFANPTNVLNSNAFPVAMTSAIVQYFTSHNIRVMVSIGGITYASNWDSALAANATQLGTNAANLAKALGVGVEIDYESTTPNTAGLTAFVNAYRAINPYDASGSNPAARLTVDLGAGDQYLSALDVWAAPLITGSTPVLDYANAMVASKQYTSASSAEKDWSQHLNGEPQYAPPVPSIAPARFTVGIYETDSNAVLPECNNYAASLQAATLSWAESAAPVNGVGTSPGLLGYMFWAAEAPSARHLTTDPPNSCQNGIGGLLKAGGAYIPMPPLTRY